MTRSTQMPIYYQSISSLSQQLEKGEISSVELTQTFLDRIKKHEGLGAYLTVNPETSLKQAEKADAKIAELRKTGSKTGLTGIPLAHKDLFVTTEFPTTAASKMLEGYMSPFDGTIVKQLKETGMVTLGKLNCDEFAMGGSNENSAFQPVLNPWKESRVPGGSSGGSAVAIAAGLAPVVTATDSGGSIRQPASFTGVTGIKPTYGRCSRYGVVAFASSFDQAGPMGRHALDCAALLQAMSGYDPQDATSADRPVEDFTAQATTLKEGATAEKPLKGIRIGLPKEYFDLATKGLDSQVEQVIHCALAEYEKLGATLVEISLPMAQLAVPAYYVLAPAEASSNMSRYDGIRYGYRTKAENINLQELYCKSRSEALGDEVKRRIIIGTFVLSHGYYDAYFVKAQKIRRLIAQDLQNAFQHCDFIASPVAPSEPWEMGVITKDPLTDYLADIYTTPANLGGLPAISIPSGFTPNALPVGLQLMANHWKEGDLLYAAHAFQEVTDWHLHRPHGFE